MNTISWRPTSLYLGLAAALAAGCGGDSGGRTPDASPSPGMDGNTGTDAGPAALGTFRNPPEAQPDANGVYQLRMTPGAITIEGQRYCVRTYDGSFPGPTLRLAASNTPRQVRVDYANGFQNRAERAVGDHTYDFNTTNLHTHGLHVRPDRSADGEFFADNVLMHLMPTESASFRFDIDEVSTHPEGTFWYHPHVHGATAIQVGSGMAGALIIEGPTDTLAGIAEAQERIFLLQHIPYNRAQPLADGVECTENNLSIDSFMPLGGPPQKTLVNGLVEPEIVVPPGQVERWRFIHGGVTQELDVSIRQAAAPGDCSALADTTVQLQQIAADGITFAAMQPTNTLFLATGYRADIMVEAPAEEGTYCVIGQYQAPGGPGAPGATVTHLISMLTVDSAAGAPTGAMPANDDLARVAPPVLDCNAALDPTFVQDVTFAQQRDQDGNFCEGYNGVGVAFNINCKQFDMTSPRTLILDRTEEWRVRTEGGPHPMHIHVNPFTVCEDDGQPVTPHWKDTLLITGRNTTRLRMEYTDFTGQFVQHCHKLHHEDEGMMELIEIVNPR